MLGALLASALGLQLLPMTTLARGTGSQILEPQQVVVRTADDWQALWKRHATGPAPAVDFQRSLVVGLFLGTRPSAGFSVEIRAARRGPDGTVVEYVEHRPPPDRVVAQMLTSPFQLVALPADAGPIEFRRLDE